MEVPPTLPIPFDSEEKNLAVSVLIHRILFMFQASLLLKLNGTQKVSPT